MEGHAHRGQGWREGKAGWSGIFQRSCKSGYWRLESGFSCRAGGCETVGGRWGAGRSGWGTDRHSLEAGAASTIRERRSAGRPKLVHPLFQRRQRRSGGTPFRSGEPGNFFSGVRKETP